jgi:hypothetical protein
MRAVRARHVPVLDPDAPAVEDAVERCDIADRVDVGCPRQQVAVGRDAPLGELQARFGGEGDVRADADADADVVDLDRGAAAPGPCRPPASET